MLYFHHICLTNVNIIATMCRIFYITVTGTESANQ